MTHESIQQYDKSGMKKLLQDFHLQVSEAVDIGNSISIPISASEIDSIVVTGLGGSAIGGDTLRSYLAGTLKIPLFVNRHYTLPAFVNNRTLVIVSSYSGNTEETIAAHLEAVKRKARILCISSGGKTTELASKYRQPIITIPRGYPPRAALGFSFFPVLMALTAMKLISSQEKDIRETIRLLKKNAKSYSSLDKQNRSLEIAKHLYTKLPIIYSSADRFDVVNLRWRGQLAENAKMLSFGHVLPEMNHNELVGWKVLRRIMQDMVVVFLKDRGDHKRVQLRMKITKDVVDQYASSVVEVASEGISLLARMFSLIQLGDWVSFYLAILNGVDPTPVRIIDYLKNELEKV